MTPAESLEFLSAKLNIDGSRSYGAHAHLSLGRGMIYQGVRHPVFEPTTRSFITVEGTIYVLTHECDLSQDNIRPFNDDVLICLLMPFEGSGAYQHEYGEGQLKSFLANLAKGRVSRLMYFPPFIGFRFGAVTFLNQICNTKTQAFNHADVQVSAALGDVGYWAVNSMIRNHFLRPRAEMLTIH